MRDSKTAAGGICARVVHAIVVITSRHVVGPDPAVLRISFNGIGRDPSFADSFVHDPNPPPIAREARGFRDFRPKST